MSKSTVLDKMRRVCGLKADEIPVPDGMPEDGILTDKAGGRTVFTVNDGPAVLAFAIDGASDETRVTAALAREVIGAALGKAAAAIEPVRAFLEGYGDIPPGVRIGRCDYYVFAVYATSRQKDIYEYISAMAAADDFVADIDGVIAFCKKVDNDSDYQSAGEFALVLRENLIEEIEQSVKIGVGGTAHGVSELPAFYAYARTALTGGAEFDPNNDIYSYKEYALIKVLTELPSVVAEKYVKTVLDKNYRAVLSDQELMTAADVFIKHSLNISEASRSMFVHRNTLIYRLDKIEKMTGLNIRNFNDAMTFRVAYLMSKMI